MRPWRRGALPADPQARVIRRQRGVIIVAVVCAVVSTTGLVLARFIKSPQQAAAETAAPEASLITAPVTEQVLATSLIVRGSVGPADRLDVTPSVSSASDATAAVVSAVKVSVGDSIRSGQVLVEVSGRPLFVLRGLVPAYRDLRPGSFGPDVRQLQVALKALGYFRGTSDGRFGPATKDAVTRFYHAIGYPVPDTGGPDGSGDKQALQAAHDAVVAAQQAVDEKKQEIAAASAQPTPAPTTSPSADTGGAPSVSQLEQELANLQAKLAQAVEAENYLIAHTGPMLPAAEVAFTPSFPARVLALSARVGAPVTAPLISISTGGLVVTAKLDPADATLLRMGLAARLDSELLGGSAEATVTAIGPVTTPTQTGQTAEPIPGNPYLPVTLTPSQPLTDAWNGRDVRVTITLARTDGAVLAVPVAAVTTRADGQTVVTVVNPDGSTRQVVVRAGASAGGLVEVTSVDGSLKAGDMVSVGTGRGTT